MKADSNIAVGSRNNKKPHKDVYVAFIDVIGVKEAASGSANLYTNRITHFQKALYDRQLILSDKNENEAHVFVYSDCAFIYSKSPDRLIDYLIAVRMYMFSNGDGFSQEPIFFKAAIVRGDFWTIDIKETASAPISDNIVEGISFSQKAVEVYLSHESSKAIGIWVAPNAHDVMDKRLVKNLHFPGSNSDNPQAFKDVRFAEKELVDDVLDEILRAFFKAKVKSKRFAKYYIPILCNWIQSLDLKKLIKDKKEEFDTKSLEIENLKEGSGRILYLVSGGYFERLFTLLPGISIFYLVILDHIYSTFLIDHNAGTTLKSRNLPTEIPAPLDSVERYLLGLKRVQRALPSMPVSYMVPAVREIFLDRLSRLP